MLLTSGLAVAAPQIFHAGETEDPVRNKTATVENRRKIGRPQRQLERESEESIPQREKQLVYANMSEPFAPLLD